MMHLDFIPLCSEEYDFAIPEEFIETITCREFLENIEKLGGYDCRDIGKIVNLVN
jgi:putative molybdopterin biosynthesis protein